MKNIFMVAVGLFSAQGALAHGGHAETSLSTHTFIHGVIIFAIALVAFVAIMYYKKSLAEKK